MNQNLYNTGDILIRCPQEHLENIYNGCRDVDYNLDLHVAMYINNYYCITVQEKVVYIPIEEFAQGSPVIVMRYQGNSDDAKKAADWALECYRSQQVSYDLKEPVISGKSPYEVQSTAYCSLLPLWAYLQTSEIPLIPEDKIIDIRKADYLRFAKKFLASKEARTMMKIRSAKNSTPDTWEKIARWTHPLLAILPISFLDSPYLAMVGVDLAQTSGDNKNSEQGANYVESFAGICIK